MINCEQFSAEISQYLDGELAPAAAAALATHAVACANCGALLETMGQMLALVRNPDYFALPDGVSQRLQVALQEGLGEPLLPRTLRPATAAPPPPRIALSRRWWALVPGRAGALAAALVLLMLGAGILRWRASASTTSGWLIDRHCFNAFVGHVADHPRDCLIKCADTGYGLVDAKGRFEPFDAKGNRSALAALKSSSKPDHVWVTVHARMSRQQVLEVQDLSLTDPAASASSR